jgi:hypothetical protein
MKYDILDIALGICLRIFGRINSEISGLTGSERVMNISEKYSSVELELFEPTHKSKFALIFVELSLLQRQKRILHIGIYGEIDEIETETFGPFSDLDIESIIKQYGYLKPVVKEGMIHYIEDTNQVEKATRKATRTLTVRYRIHDQSYVEDDEYFFNYDEDNIAELGMKYIKSLLDIHSKIYSKR